MLKYLTKINNNNDYNNKPLVMTLFNEVIGIIVILDVITISPKLMLIKRHYYTKDILLEVLQYGHQIFECNFPLPS